ncbi:MAG TPA: thioredoxin domain-containing protein [Kofleriaceae bacterium]|nr:thioredoxin domain-containing protein [Kofleriaceae bacterium]
MRSWVFLVGLLLASGNAAADKAGYDPKAIYKVPIGPNTVVGPADAPITIVAWSDYACGYCNRVQNTLMHLEQLYPGQLRWVHRTLPLDDEYTLAAEASLAAAAQGKFKPMHSRLYQLRGRVTRAETELVARELGLDMTKFRGDLDAGTYRKQIEADIADAEKLGVTGTPAFFINGRAVIGSESLKLFAQIVDEELARAAAAKAAKPASLYDALVGQGRTGADTEESEPPRDELDPASAYRIGLGLPGHQLGPDDALVTIVEWSDFQCPYCAKQAPVFEHVRQKYGDQVRIIYRHLPMSFHRDAMLAAEAGAAAAAQGKFWPFHDELWKNFGHLARADLEAAAQAAGVEMKAFRQALDERRYHDAIVAEAAAAEALGVDGTPTSFVNGLPIVGSRKIEDMDKIVDAHIANAKAMIAKGLPKAEVYPMFMAGAQGSDRADPSAVPETQQVHIAMHAEDRGRAVAAACRRRDAARAATMASGLEGDVKKRTAAVCAGEGIDLK